ncbi:hypothetical protein [Methylobacterium sp. J-070]|uniref:hypothetical protein n=1 Tax=Methylobacterium sp. J-070 TaxID=2836650 RepID=UPI001FB938F0|nr:hypothetical protein [Methylobacterium sp. J-070]MCJ2054890.1 hypothetical protein [Methylobacterium sp. J-070]
MAIVTSDGATLRAFAESVLQAAEETLDEVVPVTLAVIGGVLAEAEPGSVALQPAEAGPALLWATFGGCRMVFRFNPRTAMIELRDGTLDGHPIRLFGFRSLAMDIVNFFGALHRDGRF